MWARETHQLTGGGGTATSDAQELLSDFATEYGLASGRAPVGSTVGGMIYRVRFQIATAAPGAATQIGWGVIVHSATTALEVPRPFIDRHADWLEWGSVPVNGLNVDSTVSIGESENLGHRVRSMRKLEEVGERLWFVYELLNPGTSTLNVNGAWSTLLILP